MFNFFRRKPKREFSKKIIKDKALLNEVAIANISIGSIYPEREEVDLKHIEEMLHDITISTPILSLVRGVCSREINLRSRNGNKDLEIVKDISERFDNIENWNSFLKELAYTVYYGFSVFEKVYNEDFTLKKLVKIPRSKIEYVRSEGKWYLLGDEKIELTEDKFLIATYEDSLEYPQGKSIFNYGLLETYKDYKDLEAKVRGLQAKYGDIIPVFGFDESLATTKEGRDQVKTIAESVKGMAGGNVMAIPMSSNYSLKESFFFISLSDLKIEMHKILLQRLESKIEKFIKGSVFSEGDTGSYSKDSVQQDEKEKIEDEIAMFIGEELLKLVKYDSYLFNYTPQGLFWAFDIDEGEEAREELEKKKAETLAVKISYLKETKELGYKINKTKIAELIGVEEADLEELEETTKGFEFSRSKKKIDFYLDKTKADVESLDKAIEETKWEFSRGIFEQALNQLKKKKDIRDLFDGFKYDLTYLEEKLIISALLGNMDEREKELLEFSEDDFNPFSLKFDEAVNSILKRVPALYNDLEPITEEIRSRFTWIKKSTELETTKSLIKNLNKSLENGKSYKEWIKNSEDVLKTTGFGENGWYLNLVWRNNLHSAYNAGAFHRQEENKDNKPYGLYDSIEDGRETEICKSLDGRVYRLDHEFWNTFMPPNHHNCRSKRITLSKEDLKEYSLKASTGITKEQEELKGKMGDFIGNPASLQKILKKSVEVKEKEIGKLTEQIVEKVGYLPGRTIEEVHRNIKNITGMNDVNLTGIPLEISQKIEEKYNQIFERFPILKGGFRGLGVKKLGSGTYAACATRLGFVYVNPTYFDTMEKLEKQYERDLQIGYHPTGTSAISIITHEIGHAIDGFLTNNLLGITSEETWKSIKKKQYLTSTNLRKKILKKFKLKIADISKEVSRYGVQNDREFFAEAFSEYFDSPNPRRVAQELGQELEELIKSKGGK